MADFDPEMNVQENVQPVNSAAPPPTAVYNPAGGNKFTRNTTHPVMLVVFLISKLWFVIFGIVAMFFSINVLVRTICVSLGFALDFYICKNFAGRYLAGLRWHTYVVDGKTWYYFEADDRAMSKMEKIIFWSGMWFSPIYYIVIIIAELFTIQWVAIPLNILGMLASGMNLFAYLKCSKDAKSRMRQISQSVAQMATKAAVNYGSYQVYQGMQQGMQ